MSVTVKINNVEEEEKEQEKFSSVKIKLDIRKTLDGNLIIQDHPYIDVIVSPKTNKILALSKVDMDDKTYYTQNKFFDFLYKRGVIDPSSIQAGNIYASMEAVLPQRLEGGPDPLSVLLFTITLFIEQERPSFEYEERMKQVQDDELTDPDVENSTELGEVPHKPRKGSIGTAAYSINKHYNIAYLGEGKDKEKK